MICSAKSRRKDFESSCLEIQQNLYSIPAQPLKILHDVWRVFERFRAFAKQEANVCNPWIPLHVFFLASLLAFFKECVSLRHFCGPPQWWGEAPFFLACTGSKEKSCANTRRTDMWAAKCGCLCSWFVHFIIAPFLHFQDFFLPPPDTWEAIKMFRVDCCENIQIGKPLWERQFGLAVKKWH